MDNRSNKLGIKFTIFLSIIIAIVPLTRSLIHLYSAISLKNQYVNTTQVIDDTIKPKVDIQSNSNKNTNTTNDVYNSKNIGKSISSNSIITVDNDVTQGDIKKVQDGVNYLPNYVYNKLTQNGLKIFVTNGHINYYVQKIEGKTEKNIDSQTVGVYLYNRKMIIVNPNSYYTLHELGHSMSNILFNNFSSSSQCQYLYDKYKNSIKSIFPQEHNEYLTSSKDEFFAGCICSYFMNEDQLKNNFPEIYETIKNLFTSV